MGRVLLKSIERKEPDGCWDDGEIKAIVNVKVPLNNSTSLDQDMTVQRVGGKWIATIEFDSFPHQDTVEDAVDKLGSWLLALSKGVKGRYVKHLKLGEIFKSKNF
ncbi:hypothetical protein NVP1017O_23 [Vibrio phage 1.017.O._10N.286.55.C11]|nr:hypothetical protein NVP1017O_23 [Vibrio phage 1.017.O._10N.286.55.C11]AUR85455.1 hypothetical protein NVP1075O_23 [Vibrio phage 1.075.O._10N.286.55.B10]AUR87001.1 hypothetical protein NVP1093O_23 [Vibrio phage 1.093.O._10N.286.55.E10]AUR87074.1 hypothetical protein NVP1094O_23 [Vibrio phage 1.094.O._10N.286.55.E12]